MNEWEIILTVVFHYLWSMETRDRSSLCLLLNITSFWGISSRLGGPNGAHIANNARGGSSVFLFWPCNTLIRPLMSSLCWFRFSHTQYNNTIFQSILMQIISNKTTSLSYSLKQFSHWFASALPNNLIVVPLILNATYQKPWRVIEKASKSNSETSFQ